ncbi:MAG: RagB/SusD family nutrient uptake outer membrane protein [Spirosomaceae bacterium]|nr:RagB/SusD family nutrient uptake outer membrane protein [Spirosomataceae bacterium]
MKLFKNTIKLLKKLPLLEVGGLLVGGLLVSCELQETPYSSIFTSNFYKTAGDAEAAITGVYGGIGDLYSGPAPLMNSDFSADQVYPRPVVARNTYTLYTYDPAYSAAVSFNRTFESPVFTWTSCYRGIEKANWVIEKVPAIAMDTKRRDEIVGEALFIRAYMHWMLAKNFGDVPISNTLENAIIKKSPRAEVYKQIFADLEQAIPKLPSYSASLVKGRASKEAAQALYAKAALYAEDWAKALQQAQAVINSGKHSLMPEVKDAFDVSKEDAARVENMFAFEAESYTPGRSSQIMGLYSPANAVEFGKTGFGSIFVYPTFFSSFSPLDKRRALLDTNFRNLQGAIVPQRNITPITPRGILVKKYQDPNSVGAAHAINIPLLRYADVLLIAAEAEARATGPTATAYGFINQVRRRAGLPNLPTGLSKDAFIAAVLQERSWELFAEGDRWHDLTRTNTFMTVIPKAVNDVFPARAPQPKHRFFPIPQDEINANPSVEQNPDWK